MISLMTLLTDLDFGIQTILAHQKAIGRALRYMKKVVFESGKGWKKGQEPWFKQTLIIGGPRPSEQSPTPRYPITLTVRRSVLSQVSAFISEPPRN